MSVPELPPPITVAEFIDNRDQLFSSVVYLALLAHGMDPAPAHALLKEAWARAQADFNSMVPEHLIEALQTTTLPGPYLRPEA